MNQKEAKAELNAMIEAHLNNPNLLDLCRDVALLRTLQDKAKQALEADTEISREKHGFLLEIIDTTGKTISRKAAIDSQNSLTAAHIVLLKTALVRFILTLPDEHRTRAENVLRDSLLGTPELTNG